MKKIINIFASISLITTTSAGVVSCSSSKKTSTDESLYNRLQGKTFTIQDNKFWGNEANYQQDLLKDIEVQTNIHPQDYHLLSADAVQPFTKTGKQKNKIPIIIDHKLIAKVIIDWELTTDQAPLYSFYQQWPKISQKIGVEDDRSHISLDNGDNKTPLDWWGEKSSSQEKDLIKNGWDITQVSKYSSLSLNGSILKNMLANKIELEAGKKYANVINKYLSVSDLQMNLGQNYKLKLNDLMFKNGQAWFPLNYVEQNKNEKTIWKPWTIGFDNDYDLVRNKLQKFGTFDISDTYCEKSEDGEYHASNDKNRRVIDQALDEAHFGDIIPGLKFSGVLTKGKSSDIEVYYKDVDQDIKIPILMG